ncbi:MAG: hypothetical protein LBV51_02240 [Acholeplasmatales bacterium]|jgi:hypothetical protein|nr:hypothetical protein [Acholeplasmatales bacterium]
MKILKKILNFILDPFRYIGNSHVSEKIIGFVSRHKWIIHILAIIITFLIVLFIYISK